MKNFDVIVVGGGPAGMMAAGQAALLGKKTLLLEKMEKPGRKLLLTGKHRCNLTNTVSIEEALQEFNHGGRFLTQLYYRFYTDELRGFFKALGISTVEQRGGRVFPTNEDAREVADTLFTWMRNSGVMVLTNTPVKELVIYNKQIEGVRTPDEEIKASSIILATGGKAYPGTGSTGDGYALARRAGHTIKPLRPALVPLITAGNIAQDLQGLSLKNVSVTTRVNNKKREQLFGELMFTHFGLSGPVILTLSRKVVQDLESGNQPTVVIDLKPALSQEALNARLLRDIQTFGRKQFSSLLEGLLPKKLIPICIVQCDIPSDKKISQLSSQERKVLADWLKGGLEFTVTGHKGFGQAIITAGGVNTKEINPVTMESRIIKGLYFAGEIIDIDANTGGFNLQAAFSTGWAAGKAAGAI